MKTKKALSALTAAVLAAGMALTFPTAYAENYELPTGPYDINPAPDPEIIIDGEPSDSSFDGSYAHYFGSFKGAGTYNYYDILTDAEKQAYNDIAGAIAEDPSTQTINVSVKDTKSVYRAYCAVVLDHPEYVWLYGLSITTSSAWDYCKLTLKCCDGQSLETAESSLKAVNDKVNEITSLAVKNGCKSKYAKAKFFAEYLCDNVTYNDAAANSKKGANCWNAYGALINGSGVCESYAEAFKLLCDNSGIPCSIMVSNSHEWNYVKMDGDWYYVDSTWMDTKINGRYSYEWFLAGTESTSRYDQKKAHVPSSEAVLSGDCAKLVYPDISAADYTYTGGTADTSDDTSEDTGNENVLAKPVFEAVLSNFDGVTYNDLTVILPLVEGADRYNISIKRPKDTVNNTSPAIVSYAFYTDESLKGTEAVAGYDYLPVSGNTAYVQITDLHSFGNASVTVSAANANTSTASDAVTSRLMTSTEENIHNFVDRLYTIILDRSAETAGLWDWSIGLQNGKATSSEIVCGLANSQEFNNKALSNEQIVERMYMAMLGRASDPSGKADWLDAMANGVTVNGIIKGFSGSEEFANICSGYGISAGNITNCEARDRNVNLTSFVSRMYTKALNRAYDVSGLNDWTGDYLDGKKSANDIAYGFILSQEFESRNLTNEQYVDTLYRTFFDREPDEGGKAGWLDELAKGTSRKDVLDGFLGAEEFANLKAGFGV